MPWRRPDLEARQNLPDRCNRAAAGCVMCAVPHAKGHETRWGGRVPDELDFDGFYAATFRRVVGHVFAMTGNLSESEDSVQEAFARAWQRWDKIRAYGDPEAWVRTIAYRISVSSWRKAVSRLSAHRRSYDDSVPGLNPDHLALITALRKISADQRQAIVLYHIVGLSVDEIAAETETPAGTVKARLARGRRALAPHVSEFTDTREAMQTAGYPVQARPVGEEY